jgi:hypothetical protein
MRFRLAVEYWHWRWVLCRALGHRLFEHCAPPWSDALEDEQYEREREYVFRLRLALHQRAGR